MAPAGTGRKDRIIMTFSVGQTYHSSKVDLDLTVLAVQKRRVTVEVHYLNIDRRDQQDMSQTRLGQWLRGYDMTLKGVSDE